VWGTVFTRWEEIVGPSLARHTRPLRLESAVLVVAVDQPPWATQVRALAPGILDRLRERTGETLEHLEVVVRR
jgi:predicted nucleic acid-binding Zn ribbon protein